MIKLKKRGISLIVLIVTIIVIIILAAVVILTLSKNNPIESAKEASFKEDVRTFQDELAMYISKDYTNKAGVRDKKIKATMYTKDGSEKSVYTYIPSFKAKYEGKFVIKNDELKYNEDTLAGTELEWCSNLNIKSNERTGAEKAGASPKIYYGKTVNYSVPITTYLTNSEGEGKGKWKIFYSDGDNLYLITDSRIKLPYSSTDTSQNTFLSGYITTSEWSARFGNSYDDGIFPKYPIVNKDGSNIVDYNRTTPTKITKYASELVLKSLNESYYNQGFSPTKENEGLASMRAVISMLDTDVWSVFKDNNFADYAIGGPSLEMFCKSYSQTHDKGIEAKAFSKENGVADQYGYKVKIADSVEYKNDTDNNYISSDFNYLYRYDILSKESYWLCSPSVQTDYARIMQIGRFGAINHGYRDQDWNLCGFRPIVCLNSNVMLVDGTDGNDFDISFP